MHRWVTVARLASSDLWTERILAACSLLGVSAVLAPLVVLAGLRGGVVEGLRQLLLEDPHAREIVTAANRGYPAAILAAIGGRPDVAFLVPRTRTLSASILVQRSETDPLVRIELLPTMPGDPLVPVAVASNTDVVLTAAAAAKLRVAAGGSLIAHIGRVHDGRQEAVKMELRVLAIAPPSSFSREAAFITVALAVLVEDFQDAVADFPARLATAIPRPRQEFAGFRLYARKLEDVPGLDAALRAEGLEIVSRADEVANITAVDRSLGTLFTIVAGLGGFGFLVSLGAGLWANVERKRLELSLLRFLGFRAAMLRLFPLVQALILSAVGAGLGLGAAQCAAVAINNALAGVLVIHRPLCIISLPIATAAFTMTVGGALLVATIASRRAARMEPWEGVSAP